MTYCAPLTEAIRRFAEGFLPRERLRLSEWSNRHARLSSEASVQAGNFTAFPFQVEPLDCLSLDSPYENVVLVWASQMGKTQLILNLVSNAVAEDPGPMLVVQPTLPMAE